VSVQIEDDGERGVPAEGKPMNVRLKEVAVGQTDPREELHRSIDWKGAFWVASGVPALVLFSIGGIAGTVGTPAFAVWAASMLFGFVQAFTYAEIAGLFPNKSGGAAVYGAAAWLKYGRVIGPLSVWCNWLGWTPVLSLGCTIAAGYILNAWAPIPAAGSPEVQQWLGAHAGATADQAVAALTPAVRSWSLVTFQIPGLVHVSLGAAFFIGALLVLGLFLIQRHGIHGTARVQQVIGLLVIVPMLVVGVVPLLTGRIDWSHFSPFVPLAEPNAAAPGTWGLHGWTLILGGLFIAGWSTYAFETAVCYTRELKAPDTDTFKAITFSGLLCLVVFTVVPLTFQGFLGVGRMIAPEIVDGTGVAAVMAQMVGGGRTIQAAFILLMVMALSLSAVTAMAGSSRTLYQGSVDGWLPRYLSHVNAHGAPTRAMWTDFSFNLILLSFAASDSAGFYLILAISNVGYIIFNFLNLNAGWIHRIDHGNVSRPWRAPNAVLWAGTALAFVNAGLMGAGAKVWNPKALWTGLIACALVVPIFWFRHYIQDRGAFPDRMLEDLGHFDGELGEKRAGIWPYLALAAGGAIVLASNWIFRL
jgi:amino acid transporter